jgi:DNA-binding MarR family transcriptional regulator
MSREPQQGSWTFLTNHAQVLLRIARDSDVTLREVAGDIGITERAAQRIATDLVGAGFLKRERRGRNNHYLINRKALMRHGAQAGHQIGPLLDLYQPEERRA